MSPGRPRKPPILKRFVEFLRKDYERNEYTIGIARYIGFWAHPFYYIIWTAILPQPYESFELRFSSLVTFVPLFFYKYYPARFKPWVNLYWYFWLTLTLPVIFTYLTLMNDFSGMWLICETMMILVFIIFIPNYVMLTILMIGGTGIAYWGYVATTGSHIVLTTEIVTYLIPLPMALLLGLLSGFTIKKGELAQERNRVLQSLAGSIAHEMRNPLGQIRNCLNGIQNLLPKRHREEPPEPCTGERLERIYERVAHGQMAVKRGVQVIDMVLGEIREKPISPESFTYLSAERVTANALDEYGYESEQDRGRIHLDAGKTFTFHGNETLFVFVLFNLLKNALFYFRTHPECEITVRLEKGLQWNRLFFRDTGPGIEAEALPHIFDSFYTTGKQGGTGLGLAYCKRVMEAFGGSIRCDSVEGEFTEFELSFPVVSAKALKEYTQRIVSLGRKDFGGKRLLVVDDAPLYRATLKAFLSPLEAEIDEAANGREALELLSAKRYDLVVMDLNMPKMNGYETVERIRRGEAGSGAATTPVVAHSSEPAATARNMSENAGMQAFLAKPCSQAELITTLRAALHTLPDDNLSSGRLAGRTVLLVDDSALNRDLLAMNFRDAGMSVTVSDDGEEVLALLHDRRFDILVTDIRMPGMDGLELTRRIRSSDDPRLRRLPIIGLSGAVEEEDGARKAGMDEFRIKTDGPALLLSTIARLLASPSSESSPVTFVPPLPAAEAVIACGLSAEGSDDLVRVFIEEFHETPASMQEAFRTGDTEELRAAAHKLKGGSALLGAEEVRKAAEELESACRAGRADGAEKLVETIADALQAFSKRHDDISG